MKWWITFLIREKKIMKNECVFDWSRRESAVFFFADCRCWCCIFFCFIFTCNLCNLHWILHTHKKRAAIWSIFVGHITKVGRHIIIRNYVNVFAYIFYGNLTNFPNGKIHIIERIFFSCECLASQFRCAWRWDKDTGWTFFSLHIFEIFKLLVELLIMRKSIWPRKISLTPPDRFKCSSIVCVYVVKIFTENSINYGKQRTEHFSSHLKLFFFLKN